MSAAWDGMPSYLRLGPDELAVRARQALTLLGEERCAEAGTVAGRRRLLGGAGLGRRGRRPVEPDSPELIFVAARR
jgi:hypothetical protein